MKKYSEMVKLVEKYQMDANHLSRYYNLAKIVNELPGNDVLNIGCGYGFLEILINNKKITGLDFDINKIEVAKKVHELDENKLFLCDDLFNFRCNKKYDIIVCSEVLEHLENDRRALEKIVNCLNDSGIFVLTVPNYERGRNRILTLRHKEKEFMSSDHLREYTYDQIIQILNEHYNIIKLRGAYFKLLKEYHIRKLPLFDMQSPIRNLLGLILPKWNTYLIFVCKKKKTNTKDG